MSVVIAAMRCGQNGSRHITKVLLHSLRNVLQDLLHKLFFCRRNDLSPVPAGVSPAFLAASPSPDASR